jgi:hypothetical protein
MVIIIVVKDPGPTIAAIKRMIAIAAKISTRGSRHGAILAAEVTPGKEILANISDACVTRTRSFATPFPVPTYRLPPQELSFAEDINQKPLVPKQL